MGDPLPPIGGQTDSGLDRGFEMLFLRYRFRDNPDCKLSEFLPMVPERSRRRRARRKDKEAEGKVNG